MSETRYPAGVHCTCGIGNDDLDSVARVVRRLPGPVSNAALVLALGELEATSHERDCLWYAALLEACELRWMGIGPSR